MAQTFGGPTNCKPANKTKGRSGKVPPNTTSHKHNTAKPAIAATTGPNNHIDNMPQFAAVVAKGFAASSPTNQETHTSHKPTTRPGAPLYATVVAARPPASHPTYPHTPATDAKQVPSTKEAPTTTTTCPVPASSVTFNTLPATVTHCKAPANSTDLPSIQGFMRETDRLKRQLEEQKKSADAAANEAVDDLLAVISERETAELKLKDMSDIAAFLEADLQKATAAAKEGAARKAQEDAEARERQQALEAQVAELTKKLASKDTQLAAKNKQAQSAASAHKKELAKVQQEAARLSGVLAEPARVQALEAKVVELTEQLAGKDKQAQSAASAHKEELAKLQQEAAPLPGALAESRRLRSKLSTSEAALAEACQSNANIKEELQKEQERSAKLHTFATAQTKKLAGLKREMGATEERAALAATETAESLRAAAEDLQAALQKSEDLAEALQKEQEESAQLKAAQATQASQTEAMRTDMITTQQKAALAIRDFTLSERALGQQLHAAQAQIATKNQVIAELRTAAEAANKQATDANTGARISQATMTAALTRARAAETALSAAQHDMQLARAEAGAAQGTLRLLQAERSTHEKEIQMLRGQLMDLGAPEVTYTAPEDPQATHSAPANPDAAASSSCEGVHPLFIIEAKDKDNEHLDSLDVPQWRPPRQLAMGGAALRPETLQRALQARAKLFNGQPQHKQQTSSPTQVAASA